MNNSPKAVNPSEAEGCLAGNGENEITERRRAEEVVRTVNEGFETIAQATDDAIWDWNLQTDHLRWNDGVQRLFGYALEQIADRIDWWYEHIYPQDRDRVVRDIHKVIDTGGQEWSDEYRFVKADGTTAEVFDRGFVVRDREGKPLRMLGGMTDITAKNQTQRLLFEQKNLLELIASGRPLDECLTELTGAVARLSPRARRHTAGGPRTQNVSRLLRRRHSAVVRRRTQRRAYKRPCHRHLRRGGVLRQADYLHRHCQR